MRQDAAHHSAVELVKELAYASELCKSTAPIPNDRVDLDYQFLGIFWSFATI